MNKIRFIVMLTLTVAFLSLLAAVPAVAGKPLHHASGDGFFNVVDSPTKVNDFVFQFNARQMKTDGTANGHMEFHNLTKGYDNYMNIDFMMMVDERSVLLEGIVSKSNNPNVDPGDCKTVYVQDNGEGRNAPDDQISKFTNCGNDTPLYPLDGGNIQVR